MNKTADTWSPELKRWIPDSVPEIEARYVDTDPEEGRASHPEHGGDDYFKTRRPLIYDGRNNVVYVGGYNQTHNQAGQSHGIINGDIGDLPSGMYNFGAWFPGEDGHVSWLYGSNLRPEWEDAIAKKLNGENYQSQWKLGTNGDKPFPIPDDPRMEPWEFGQPGKGFYHPESGKAWAWKTYAPPSRYHEGLDFPEPYHNRGGIPEQYRKGLIPTWISPEGEVSNRGYWDNRIEGILQYHPDLSIYDPEKNWKLEFGNHWGKLAWEMPDQSKPPEIVELSPEHVAPPYEEDPDDYAWLHDRQPFVYYPEDHQVIVGPRGTFHSQIAPTDQYEHYGAILYPTTKGNFDPGIKSFGEPVPKSVVESLSKRYNLPVQEDPWTIQSSEDKHKSWHRGEYGKGLLTKDNQLFHWIVGDEGFGRPHHVEAFQELGLDPSNLDAYVYFNPDGTFATEPYGDNPVLKDNKIWKSDIPDSDYSDAIDERVMRLHPELMLPDEDSPWEFTPVQSTISSTLSGKTGGKVPQKGLYNPTLHVSGNWDPLTCGHCGGRMTEPKKVGYRWMNYCTNCGGYREVPSDYPLLKQQQQDEGFTQYPEMLQELNQGRPWTFAKQSKHQLNWEEGNEGKGLLLDDGTLHTWNVDDVRMPNHITYLKENGLYNNPGDLEQVNGYFEINPEGKLYHADVFNPKAIRQVEQAAKLDPRLTPANGSHWDLR